MPVDKRRLRRRLQREYRRFAQNPSGGEHGRGRALKLGYPRRWLNRLSPWVVEPFAGTGNPFARGPLPLGARVLDVGCGAGLDSILAALAIRPNGRLIGIDLTPAMVYRARRSAARAKVSNLQFIVGLAEALPIPDESTDTVISNGVILFCPDKRRTLREFFRVLKPGGALLLGAVTMQRLPSEAMRRDLSKWVH